MAYKDTETLLQANPHHWGPGAVHLFVPETQKTMCGKGHDLCPGTLFKAPLSQVTCKGCIRCRQVAIEREENRKKWEIENEERKLRQEQEQREWWEAYNRYLESPEWREKRELVLLRAHHQCEGCARFQARQVHHLRYPRNCFPGSEEWILKEKLFDLVAICDRCHEDVHTLLI